MKWSLNINQYQAVELGLKNAQEAIILGMICDVATWAEPIIIENEVFYWASRTRFVDDLPLLDLKNDTVYRYFRSLERLGLILYKKEGKKDCLKLTQLGKSYYVGKKFEQFLNSEKNSSEFRKKSEKNSEIFPIYPITKSYPSTNISPLRKPMRNEVGHKLYISTLTDVADMHRMTISTIEDYLEFRANSGGIDTPIAFAKYVLREVANPYSDESVQLEEWFEALKHTDIIDHLVNQFLSTQRTDRRFCRELSKDDFALKAHNIVPSDVVIEIAYQRAEVKRRERVGGVV